MRTTIVVAIEVEHNGDMTQEELASTIGAALSSVIANTHVSSETDDGQDASFTIVECVGAL